MSRHGWVNPLPSGAVARCGGPGMCSHCMAEVLVSRGCPTETDRAGNGVCFYCNAPNYREIGGRLVKQEIPHEPGCPWPPFAKAYS